MITPVQDKQPLVRARNVHKAFDQLEVLKGIDLDVFPGEVVVVLGPSGSGKSTFLRCINHLESINRGSIEVDGEQIGYQLKKDKLIKLSGNAIAAQRRNIGMVFQQFNLWPHMTALGNVSEALRTVHKMSRTDAEARAMAQLVKVGLEARAGYYPAQLSGGQQQRVAIARALALKPKIMLFDEPTSSLDPELTGEVLNVMRDLAAEGMTMVVVSHEIGFAATVGSRISFLDQGRLLFSGPPSEVFGKPRHPRLEQFLDTYLDRGASMLA